LPTNGHYLLNDGARAGQHVERVVERLVPRLELLIFRDDALLAGRFVDQPVLPLPGRRFRRPAH